MTELYVGSRIEHESERVVLQRIVDLLARDQRPAVILANTNLGDRQIDFVVALSDIVLVIEAKGFTRPIRGGENGPWQVQVASGDWKDFRSPYLQARDAALKVRDEVRLFERSEISYPTVAVVFVPAIPHGSKPHPGDFKVSVLGLDGLDALLRKRQKDAWPLNRWKAFAEYLRLTPVRTVTAACDPALFVAEGLLRQYQKAFRRANICSESLVPFTCRCGGQVLTSEEVTRMVAIERASILIRGPSGCGKTLLATQAGLAFAQIGAIVISIRAGDYSGSVKAVVDREIGLLIRSKATNVLSAARALNRPLLFLVDGYNECGGSERASLTRGLVALARDYQGSVLVTSQIPLVGGDLLALRSIDVPSADMETKAAIARNVLGSGALPSKLEDLLEAVTTGLEAKLIGEIGRELSPGSSRYALFDAFARRRLGDNEREGIRLLSLIAGRLCDRVAFSVSRRDLDRLADEFRIPEAVAMRVRQAGFLIQRGDRVHFTHELFFDAFAAEDVIRRASGEPMPVMKALACPQHAGRKAFILGAIDDDLQLETVLEQLEDSVSVASCLSGVCGRKAQEWTAARAAELWERLRSEALAVSFRISNHDRSNVACDTTTLIPWTALEWAFLNAISQLIERANYLDEVLDIIGILDRRLAEEDSRLREEAGELKVAFRSALFASSYVFPSAERPGIGHVCKRLYGSIYRSPCEATKRALKRRLAGNRLTAGQIYLLLILTRGSDIPMATIARAIKSHWKHAPYHLRLDLMDAARMGRQSRDQDRESLIETIGALPHPKDLFLSTEIVDALASLGAFEHSEHEYIAVVRKEIRQCLADSDDHEKCTSAYSLYAAQIEHPYSRAYSEAIAELRDGERKTLFMMASRGAQDAAFYVDLLLIDLTSLGDSKSGGTICRWTALPATDSVTPQEAVAVFMIAHIALALLGCALPTGRVADGQAAKGLVVCGEILYWCNRHDLDEIKKRRRYYPLVQELGEHVTVAALDVIRHCEWTLSYDMERMLGEPSVARSIAGRFPDEVADICRRSLSDPTNQVGYFQQYSKLDQTMNLEFAIGVLAGHGNSADLRGLRRYANDTALGTDCDSGNEDD